MAIQSVCGEVQTSPRKRNGYHRLDRGRDAKGEHMSRDFEEAIETDAWEFTDYDISGISEEYISAAYQEEYYD